MLCVQLHCQQCAFLWKTVYRRPKSRFHTDSCSEATDLRVEVTATMLHPVKRGSERLYTSKHDAIGQKRGFEHATGMSASPPNATELLHCDDSHHVPKGSTNSRTPDQAPIKVTRFAGGRFAGRP